MQSAILTAFLLLAGVGVLLLAPIGLGPYEYARALEDLAHAPIFAVAAIVCYTVLSKRLPRTQAYLYSFGAAVGLGVAAEVAQSFTSSRSAELGDVAFDAAGALAGLCWYALRDKTVRLRTRRKRQLRAAIVVVVVLVLVPLAWTGINYFQRRVQVPELATWRSASGYHFTHGYNGKIIPAVVPGQWAKADEAALFVTPGTDGRYAGVALDEPWPSWDDAIALELELINPNDRDLELTLRVEDQLHNNEYDDRYNKALVVPAGQRVIKSFSIAEMRDTPASRRMEMDRIHRIVLFQDLQRGKLAYYLCKIRLKR